MSATDDRNHASEEANTSLETHAPHHSYETDRDDRYFFKFFDVDLLRALGRLTLNASYLEGVIQLMFARILDNEDLELGERVTADAAFRWLIDHTRALSEHRLSPELHSEVKEWLSECNAAYGRRNAIIHSGHYTHIAATGDVQLRRIRATARKPKFTVESSPLDADDVHEAAKSLEEAGLRGLSLMTRVRQEIGPTQPD